jgi:peptide subunit release factor RF-3
MNESTFRSYMAQAKQLGGEYGRGYQRGLRRHHHGASFGTTEEHKRWMRAAEEPHRAEAGRGYRDGHAGRAPTPGDETAEEATTLNVRGIPAAAAERIKRGAAARAMTIGQYLDALSRLHDEARALADDPLQRDDRIVAVLAGLGLQTVHR